MVQHLKPHIWHAMLVLVAGQLQVRHRWQSAHHRNGALLLPDQADEYEGHRGKDRRGNTQNCANCLAV